MVSEYVKAEHFSLGGTLSGWSEAYIQSLISDDPSILGLGDLEVKEKERRQAGAGRLDFLLQDSPVTTRFEVEIQLGDTNPSHIIRTIEYWEREQRTAPQYDHVAVIVAEGITARFFNVIHLFNRHIPLIAIKMSAVQVGDKRSIVFTRVLDYSKRAVEDDEAGIPETNKSYWDSKAPQQIMSLVDSIVAVSKKVDTTLTPKYNKNSIALKKGTDFFRFLTLWPKKKFVNLALPVTQSESMENELSAASIDFDPYDSVRHRYVLTLAPGDLPKNADLLGRLIAAAYEQVNSESEAEGIE